MSSTLCLAVCCRECQYFQFFSCSSLPLSSPKTTMITLYRKIWSRIRSNISHYWVIKSSASSIFPHSPVQYCSVAAQSLPRCTDHSWIDSYQLHGMMSLQSLRLSLWADAGMIWSRPQRASKGRTGRGSSRPWVLLLGVAGEITWPPGCTGSCHCKDIMGSITAIGKMTTKTMTGESKI